jgi:riboflavin kinase / FMN adenylyltransferase
MVEHKKLEIVRGLNRPLANANGRALALAIGNFDGVHEGHRVILAQLRSYAAEHNLQAAVMSFEPLPREYFARAKNIAGEQSAQATQPARLSSVIEKAAYLQRDGIEGLFIAKFNEAFSAQTPAQFIASLVKLNLKRLMVGADFRFGANRAGSVQTLQQAGETHGFTVAVLDDVTVDGMRVSSTQLRQKLSHWAANSHVKDALNTGFLKHPYSIVGRVTHGKKLGRTLGFPTVNIALGALRRLKPALHGVFAVNCYLVSRGLEGVAGDVLATPVQTWKGVANLGTNPAVQSDGKYSLEAFLFDYSGDLYGKRLRIEFVAKIRNEANFASLDALMVQMHDDCAKAEAWLS